jgi:hypothetical protein
VQAKCALNVVLRRFSYPYPLFEQVDTAWRAMIFTGAALTMTVSTVILQWLYERVNGIEEVVKSTTSNTKDE